MANLLKTPEIHDATKRACGPMSSHLEESDLPVLVLGSGITALGVIRSLGSAQIPAYSLCPRNDLVTQSRWYRPAPQISSRVPSPDELPEYLATLSIPKAVLIPCTDDWTKAVAGLPENLKERFPASISPPLVVETMINKWRFAETLQQLGVPRPRTILLHSLEEMAVLPDSQYENMFLKPLDSLQFSACHGVKAFRVESKRYALEIMAKTQRNGTSGFPILLQEYIPGPARSYYLVDGFVDRHHRICALIARRRLRMHPQMFGNSTLSESVPVHQVRGAVDTLERLWSALDYRGIFDAEFKYDDCDGQFKIVEVNARPWWHIGFTTGCGVNLCRMSYRDALGLPVESITSYPVGRRALYLLLDLPAHCATDPGVAGLLRWMRSWKGAQDAFYCWNDPRPGIWVTLASFKRVRRALQIFRSALWP